MTDAELSRLLVKTETRMHTPIMRSDLPEVVTTSPQITFPKETVKRFRDSFNTLLVFSSHVCGIDPELLSVFDMENFLCKREKAKEDLKELGVLGK